MAVVFGFALVAYSFESATPGTGHFFPCVAGQTSSQFAYGLDGLRKQSTVNGTVTRYILDSSMVFRETNGQNVPQVTYLIGPRGPEYRRTGSGENAQVRWYCGACPEERRDVLGSVLAEVDPAGYITGARQMDVYGAPRATQGSPTSKHAYVGALGHPTEDDTGLIYMRARWMDPVTGTFVSEDPARDGANWFSYCAADPTNLLDASGGDSYSVALALAASGLMSIVRGAVRAALDFIVYQGGGSGGAAALISVAHGLYKGTNVDIMIVDMTINIMVSIAMQAMSTFAGVVNDWADRAGAAIEVGNSAKQAIYAMAAVHNIMLGVMIIDL